MSHLPVFCAYLWLQSSVIEMLLDVADEELACEVYDEGDVLVKSENVSMNVSIIGFIIN